MITGKAAITNKLNPSVTPHKITVLGMITAGTMINYLHRIVLAVAAPLIAVEFNFEPATMGFVFAAFSWTYAFAQIPGGIILDHLGSRRTYFLAASIWSLFTIFHSLATGIISLIIMRLGLGLGQAPCFPTNARVIRHWFKPLERARATATFTVGEYIILAGLSPLLYWIMVTMGWRVLFLIVGIAGIMFSLVWLVKYREAPSEIISNPQTQHPTSNPINQTLSAIWSLVKHRQILGLCLGGFAGNTTLIFFLTWFPTYLATERQMEWLQSGLFSIFPFLAAAVGVITGGCLSDYLLRKTKSANLSRKLPVVLGLLLAANILWANIAEHNITVITILSVAFFGQGMTGLGWTLIADIAPPHHVGLTGGICNFATNIAGFIAPVVIGMIIAKTGSFHYALVYISLMAVLGVCSYLFVIGDVQPISIKQ